MTDERITTGEEQVPPTEEKRPNPEQAKESTPEDRLQNADSNDYRSLYEKELERRERAEQKLVKTKRKMKESRSDESDEDEGLDIERLVEEKVNQATQKLTVDGIISQYTTNPDEQKLVRLHLDDIKSSGDLRTDVRRALLLANENYYLSLKKETDAMRKSTDGTDTSVSTSSQKPQTEVAPEAKNPFVEKFSKNLPPRYKNAFNKQP